MLTILVLCINYLFPEANVNLLEGLPSHSRVCRKTFKGLLDLAGKAIIGNESQELGNSLWGGYKLLVTENFIKYAATNFYSTSEIRNN